MHGAPMPESGQQKCDRVRVARQLAGLDTASVKQLLEKQFQRTSPSQLSSEQVDALIQMIEAPVSPHAPTQVALTACD